MIQQFLSTTLFIIIEAQNVKQNNLKQKKKKKTVWDFIQYIWPARNVRRTVEMHFISSLVLFKLITSRPYPSAADLLGRASQKGILMIKMPSQKEGKKIQLHHILSIG